MLTFIDSSVQFVGKTKENFYVSESIILTLLH